MAFDLKDENWSAELVLPVANQGLHSIFKSVTETQRKIIKTLCLCSLRSLWLKNVNLTLQVLTSPQKG